MAFRNVKKVLGISAALVACAVGGTLYYSFHPHSYTLTEAKEPSCTEEGYKYYKCWCGSQSKETIDAIGHDYKAEIAEASCTEDGKEVFTCINCGDTYEEIVKAMGHNYKEEITKEPSCTEEGAKTLTCNNCGDTYTEEIESLGHSFVDGICERCGELSEEKKKAAEESKKQDNGGSNKPSGNSGQTGTGETSGNSGNAAEEAAAQCGMGTVDWGNSLETGNGTGDLEWH